MARESNETIPAANKAIEVFVVIRASSCVIRRNILAYVNLLGGAGLRVTYRCNKRLLLWSVLSLISCYSRDFAKPTGVGRLSAVRFVITGLFLA